MIRGPGEWVLGTRLRLLPVDGHEVTRVHVESIMYKHVQYYRGLSAAPSTFAPDLP